MMLRHGLESGSADVVIGEAMLTMQGEKSKKAIIPRPCGCWHQEDYAIHELAVRPDTIDEDCMREFADLARAIL